MPYHGTVKSVQHAGQSWTLVVERPPESDYAMVFDNTTFRVFYDRLIGADPFDHLLRFGEWAIRHCLVGQRLSTPSSSPRPAEPR